MLDKVKDTLLERMGTLMGSERGINLLANSSFQTALARALNLRADLREHWDRQIQMIAQNLNLVSKRDVADYKRQIRDLENMVATLQHQLKQESMRADKAQRELAQSKKTAGTSAKAAPATAKKTGKAAAAKKKEQRKSLLGVDEIVIKGGRNAESDAEAAAAAAKRRAASRGKARQYPHHAKHNHRRIAVLDSLGKNIGLTMTISNDLAKHGTLHGHGGGYSSDEEDDAAARRKRAEEALRAAQAEEMG